MDGMTGLSYRERLLSLDLYSVYGRLTRAEDLFSPAPIVTLMVTDS